jgi:hypothetical protein
MVLVVVGKGNDGSQDEAKSGLLETLHVPLPWALQTVDIGTERLVISEDSIERGCSRLVQCKLGEIVRRGMLSDNVAEKPVA